MSKQVNHFIGRYYFAMSGLPIYVEHRPYNPPHAFHDHDFLEIVLVLNGKAKHQVSKYKYEISKGDILIIPVHHEHAYLSPDKLEIINLLFDPQEAAKIFFDLPEYDGYQQLFSNNILYSSRSKHRGCLRISPAKFALVSNLLTNFIAEINGQRPGYKAMAASLFVQAICIICRYQEHINTPSASLLLARLEQAIAFVEAHYEDKITLDQMARLARMSKSSFQRSFWKLTNISPIKYLVNYRVRKAGALLLYHPELNITEIAFQVGFSDSNYFSRMFKKIMGHTPREFRQGSRALE